MVLSTCCWQLDKRCPGVLGASRFAQASRAPPSSHRKGHRRSVARCSLLANVSTLHRLLVGAGGERARRHADCHGMVFHSSRLPVAPLGLRCARRGLHKPCSILCSTASPVPALDDVSGARTGTEPFACPGSLQRRRGLDWTCARGCLCAHSLHPGAPEPAGRLREGLSKSLAPGLCPCPHTMAFRLWPLCSFTERVQHSQRLRLGLSCLLSTPAQHHIGPVLASHARLPACLPAPVLRAPTVLVKELLTRSGPSPLLSTL